MSWSERQRRMLAGMGIRLWSPAEAAAIAPAPVPVPASPAREPVLAEPVVAVVERPAPAAPVQAPPPARPPARVTPASAPVATAPALTADPALAERATAIAAMPWGVLRDAVAACTACGLCETRKNTVFGVGHAQADWMVIGEAPGEQEALAGEPFVGPAGQLLDQMLRALNLTRRGPAGEGVEDDQAGDPARRVFIANTLKCRPPRNRNPEPDEMARCEPFLQRQVALVKPRLILLMGRFAVKQLLKSDDAIGKLRGRVHHYEGIPVIVTYHPAYLLRNLPEKAKAWEDLCLAKGVSEGVSEGYQP